MKIIKTTDLKERQAAYDIRKTVFVTEQHVPIEEEIDEFEEDSIHFVCCKDDKPVGTSRLRLFPEFGKLERIAVLKPYRGNSIGSRLIAEMEAEITAHQGKLAKLNAQTHAISFYESLGYEVVSGEFLDAGIPHVTMTKQLPPS